MLHGFEQVVPVEVAEEMVRRGELDPAPPEVGRSVGLAWWFGRRTRAWGRCDD